ncbi:hypothetical protein [Segeticoccus rhizosphaerae]|uniref:hypothetical protein n=1 Tax=Segeticoccus rhizosphaerae TaxID=1104777 RepID=UPI001265A98F|nr:hypothetical protein [Segeticoccus rhizosphaerae]
MTQLQRLVGRVRVDHAARGVGKTSLLRRAQQQAEELGAVTVWVTAGEAVALIPAVAEEVGRVTRGWDAAGRGQVRAALEHLEVKVTGGVPGVASVEATWQGDPARQSFAAQGSTREFEDLVVAASAAAGERGRRGGGSAGRRDPGRRPGRAAHSVLRLAALPVRTA